MRAFHSGGEMALQRLQCHLLLACLTAWMVVKPSDRSALGGGVRVAGGGGMACTSHLGSGKRSEACVID